MTVITILYVVNNIGRVSPEVNRGCTLLHNGPPKAMARMINHASPTRRWTAQKECLLSAERAEAVTAINMDHRSLTAPSSGRVKNRTSYISLHDTAFLKIFQLRFPGRVSSARRGFSMSGNRHAAITRARLGLFSTTVVGRDEVHFTVSGHSRVA